MASKFHTLINIFFVNLTKSFVSTFYLCMFDCPPICNRIYTNIEHLPVFFCNSGRISLFVCTICQLEFEIVRNVIIIWKIASSVIYITSQVHTYPFYIPRYFRPNYRHSYPSHHKLRSKRRIFDFCTGTDRFRCYIRWQVSCCFLRNVNQNVGRKIKTTCKTDDVTKLPQFISSLLSGQSETLSQTHSFIMQWPSLHRNPSHFSIC